MSPQLFTLDQVDFITVGTAGPADQPTFYLQAAQGDLVVSVVIEKEQAAALSLGIDQMLEELGGIPDEEWGLIDVELRCPVRPLFQADSLGLGYNAEVDALVIVARAPVAEADERREPPEIHLWGTRVQMLALAERAAALVAAGLSNCPLCDEPLKADERHVCARGNGRKWFHFLDE
ncbi:MAG: DUF3090 family protein [Anaerolineae bacterium]|jgi:uncharacterized repeat protein (TIGR03847 family)